VCADFCNTSTQAYTSTTSHSYGNVVSYFLLKQCYSYGKNFQGPLRLPMLFEWESCHSLIIHISECDFLTKTANLTTQKPGMIPLMKTKADTDSFPNKHAHPTLAVLGRPGHSKTLFLAVIILNSNYTSQSHNERFGSFSCKRAQVLSNVRTTWEL
jgi:hypothetical protein